MISDQCLGDQIQNRQRYFKATFNSDFNSYDDRTHNQVMLSAIKAKGDDIHFEGDLLKSHIKSDIKKDLISNNFFVKNTKKQRTTLTVKV